MLPSRSHNPTLLKILPICVSSSSVSDKSVFIRKFPTEKYHKRRSENLTGNRKNYSRPTEAKNNDCQQISKLTNCCTKHGSRWLTPKQIVSEVSFNTLGYLRISSLSLTSRPLGLLPFTKDPEETAHFNQYLLAFLIRFLLETAAGCETLFRFRCSLGFCVSSCVRPSPKRPFCRCRSRC